jgi:manganese/zinc/iron transport system ATP- binding protein
MRIEQTAISHKSLPLKIRDLTVAYHRKPVIWDIDLSIPEGKLVSIVGPNGAGKSTLIKACLELIPRSSGEVSIYGKSYKKARKQVGYVPQRESVDWDFPVSALDVVAMGTLWKTWLVPPREQALKGALYGGA